MARLSKQLLVGEWRRSHEEDRGEATVYRHATFPFPPARGRMGFDLKADGSAHEILIAPTDGSQKSPAHWSVRPGRILVIERPQAMRPRRFHILALSADRLELKEM